MEINKGSPSNPKEDMTETEKAWLASGIDTDGHIFLSNLHGKSHEPVVGVSNSNRDYVAKAAELMGVTIQEYFLKNMGGKPFYRAVCQGRWSASIILEQIRPYLIIKRDRADQLLEWIADNMPSTRVSNILDAWERTGKRFGKVVLVCENCGTEFIIWKSRQFRKGYKRRFCSRRCYNEWRKKKSIENSQRIGS